MSIYTLGDFELSIGGEVLGTVKPFSADSFIEATTRLMPMLEPFEFSFELSPECTGRMPDCVKRTRRSRRRWRGKGRDWNSLWKGWL